MPRSGPPKTKACLQGRNHGRPRGPATWRDRPDGDRGHHQGCSARHRDRKGLGRRSERTPMPAMQDIVLERRLRRADLPSLQGVERVAKRRACQPRCISAPLTRIEAHPTGASFCLSHFVTPQPTETGQVNRASIRGSPRLRSENSHLPFRSRERELQRFRQTR